MQLMRWSITRRLEKNRVTKQEQQRPNDCQPFIFYGRNSGMEYERERERYIIYTYIYVHTSLVFFSLGSCCVVNLSIIEFVIGEKGEWDWGGGIKRARVRRWVCVYNHTWEFVVGFILWSKESFPRTVHAFKGTQCTHAYNFIYFNRLFFENSVVRIYPTAWESI